MYRGEWRREAFCDKQKFSRLETHLPGTGVCVKIFGPDSEQCLFQCLFQANYSDSDTSTF